MVSETKEDRSSVEALGARLAERISVEGVALGASRLAASFVVASLTLALLNALMIVLFAGEAEAADRLLHHFFDAGHLLALGLMQAALGVFALVCWRWVRARSVFFAQVPLLASCVVLLTLGMAVVMSWDLQGFISRQADAGSTLPWVWLLSGGGALGLALAVGGASFFARRGLPLLWALAGGALGFANHLILPESYPGFHLLLAVLSLSWFAVFYCTSPSGAWLDRLSARRLGALCTIFCLVAACSLVLRPSPTVWRQLYRLPGTVLPPFIALIRSGDAEVKDFEVTDSEWYRDRSAIPPIVPTPYGGLSAAPVVLLVTVDALRADLLLDPKYRAELPHLWALADESLHFTQARSPSPSTATTFTAMYTGKYYSATRWSGKKEWVAQGEGIWPSRDRTKRVAQLLDDAGVSSANVRMVNMFGKSHGISRGFANEIKVGHYANAQQGVNALLEQLKKQTSEPRFLAMHLIDPHAPYSAGKAGKKKSRFEKYLAEVAYVDGHIGRLVQAIGKSPYRDRIILVFSSDHGEAFGEHGSYFHASTMYEELLRVPLLVSGKGITPGRSDAPVSLIDMGPTLLDLFDQPTPGWFMGTSLKPFLVGGSVELSRPLAAESGRRMQSLVLPSGLKAIVDLKRNTQEVYDLRVDPGERKNLAGRTPAADRAIAALREFFSVHHLPDYDPPWSKF